MAVAKTMPQMEDYERRRRTRTEVTEVVDVNSGKPHRGGVLHDISSTGAAIYYCKNVEAIDAPLQIGDELRLTLSGVTVLPGRIARTFDGGYAVQFDWSMDVYKAFI